MLPEVAKAKVQDLLNRTGRILTQRTKDKNKLYALHAPEVECISKGKARTPYEFGVKVSIATTLREGLVVGMRSMPGNPYDGHTLAETLEQVGILTGTDKPPATAIVDKGYRRVEIEGVRILRSGQRRGITRTLKAMFKRRSAIEPAIGHMKKAGRLARNPLKGALGDALHAVVRRRAQPAPDTGRAAALLRPRRAADAGGHCSTARRYGREPTALLLRIELFRAD